MEMIKAEQSRIKELWNKLKNIHKPAVSNEKHKAMLSRDIFGRKNLQIKLIKVLKSTNRNNVKNQDFQNFL